MTKVQECLAQNIKQYRKLRNMTQEQLAEKAETATNYIGTIEIGKKFPSPQMIERIADALDIDSLLLFQSKSTPIINVIQPPVDVSKLKDMLCKKISTELEAFFTPEH